MENAQVTCVEFQKWVEKYNDHGVLEPSTYPFETIEKVSNANIIITSDLKRAVQSATLLRPKGQAISSPIFRETELPAPSMTKVKLRPSIWAILLRLVWFCGYSHQCESMRNAKARANKAAEQLINYAKEHQSVALIGHGFFNMLIAKELQKKGWKGKRKTGAKHWNCTTYTLSNPS